MRASADALQIEKFRRMSPSQKLALAARLRKINLDLLTAGLQAGNKRLSPRQLRLEILRRTLPERLFRATYVRP